MKHFSNTAHWLEPIAVVVLAAALFTVLVGSHTFADPDAFYHAKMGSLLSEQGIVRDFRWLPYTELAKSYADQHLLYHVALVPFVTLMDPLVGIKVAAVMLGAAFALTFYLVLKRLRISGAFIGTLALLLVSPFTFRLALAKGNAFALIILWLALYCAFTYRPRALGVVTFLFVWAYGGFPVLFVTLACFVVGAAIVDALERRRHPAAILARLFPASGERLTGSMAHTWRLAGAALIGAIVGLVVNPYFPNNLPFLFNQFLRIGVVNYRSVIGVGGEWYPYPPLELATTTIILSVPLLVALVAFMWTASRQTRRSWALLLLTVGFFVLTLKSRRYVEYYVPLGMFFALSALSDAVRSGAARRDVASFVKRLFQRWRTMVLTMAFLVYLFIMVPSVAVRDMIGEWRDLRRGFTATQYASAMTWLRGHTTEGAVVVHSDWDEFPLLFYYDERNRYIAGLDPTFLYTADRGRYQTWVDISTGRYTRPLSEGLQLLGAQYAFVDAQHGAMRDLMEANPDVVHLVYQDDEASLYEVR